MNLIAYRIANSTYFVNTVSPDQVIWIFKIRKVFAHTILNAMDISSSKPITHHRHTMENHFWEKRQVFNVCLRNEKKEKHNTKTNVQTKLKLFHINLRDTGYYYVYGVSVWASCSKWISIEICIQFYRTTFKSNNNPRMKGENHIISMFILTD